MAHPQDTYISPYDRINVEGPNPFEGYEDKTRGPQAMRHRAGGVFQVGDRYFVAQRDFYAASGIRWDEVVPQIAGEEPRQAHIGSLYVDENGKMMVAKRDLFSDSGHSWEFVEPKPLLAKEALI